MIRSVGLLIESRYGEGVESNIYSKTTTPEQFFVRRANRVEAGCPRQTLCVS